MRLLQRNLQNAYYCLYKGKVEITDEDGNGTGEYKVRYSKPNLVLCNISPASGIAQTEIFGNLDNYDRVIVLDDTSLKIDENSVFCIDVKPVYKDEEVNFNYIVKRVAKSLNQLSIVVTKVTVS